MSEQSATRLATSKDASDAPEREILTWELFGTASRASSRPRSSSPMDPRASSRSPAAAYPRRRDLVRDGCQACGTMNVEFYTGVGQTLEEPVLLPPLMDVSAMNGSASSSSTTSQTPARRSRWSWTSYRHPRPLLDGEAPVKVDARCAVIYKKPVSIIEPDYVCGGIPTSGSTSLVDPPHHHGLTPSHHDHRGRPR